MTSEKLVNRPYTAEDLNWGERIVRELHGVKGYQAWAEHLAKERAATRPSPPVSEEAVARAVDDLDLALEFVEQIARLPGRMVDDTTITYLKLIAERGRKALSTLSTISAPHRAVPSPRTSEDICAACGSSRREHETGGTRYGHMSLCGAFIPQTVPSPREAPQHNIPPTGKVGATFNPADAGFSLNEHCVVCGDAAGFGCVNVGCPYPFAEPQVAERISPREEERERCARIADAVGLDITHDEELKPLDVGMAIAFAIRNPEIEPK